MDRTAGDSDETEASSVPPKNCLVPLFSIILLMVETKC
jgi:hypothetical protein